MICDKFGLRVKLLRLKAKLSQEELSETVGLHRTYIGMVERGEKNISLRNIEKISIALDTPLASLFKEL